MSDHNTHHDDHGHDQHETKKPHAGFFEVPILLGLAVWALVVMIININCMGPNTCCNDEQCCKPEGGEKTEMPAHH
jgi:hypothetical protein